MKEFGFKWIFNDGIAADEFSWLHGISAEVGKTISYDSTIEAMISEFKYVLSHQR